MEDKPLANYSFVPWFRQGLATQITLQDQLGASTSSSSGKGPASFPLNLHLKGDGTEKAVITKQVNLIGPGEITGIESRAIIKTEPLNRVQNFEHNYFPYIEFYDEDFPWRYTPLAPNGDRLRPWLALVVLKGDEFERLPFNGILQSFSLMDGPVDGPLPPAHQSWAWAHVHVNRNLYASAEDAHQEAQERLESVVRQSPNQANSRILCPRKLEPNTSYHAFLIPVFEKGRLAGLGAPKTIIDDTDIQLASWGHAQDHFGGDWPIYHEWQFKTGSKGEDFEAMAQKIEPRQLDANVGQQWIDIQSPGYKLFFEGGEEPNKGSLLMAGALRVLPKSPESIPESSELNLLDQATDDHPEIVSFVEDLAALINLEEDLKEDSILSSQKFATNPYFEEDNTSIYDDPIITPPLYGRWHALQEKVNTAGKQQWVDQLNLDPRHRIAAGLGAEVIRRNQELYMDRAWEQFGELFQVNEYFRKVQFIMQVNENLYLKHLSPLTPARLASVTTGMHGVIRYGSGSLKGYIKGKDIPKAVMTTSYDKITRPKGALMRRTTLDSNIAAANIDGIGSLNTIDRNPWDYEARIAAEEAGQVYLELPHVLYQFIASAVVRLRRFSIPSWKTSKLKAYGVNGPMAFEQALRRSLGIYFDRKNWKLEQGKNALNLTPGFKSNLLESFHPRTSYLRRISASLSVDVDNIKDQDDGLVPQILKAPSFPDPMYEEIVQISSDLLIPNLDLIQSNTIALMKTNRTFIESYLIGLNHEMARELLWREFPTDQRGTYFRQFWDARDNLSKTDYKDITAIHSWAQSPLGSHPGENNEEDPLVFVIRADLLTRYPDVIIYMEKAKEVKIAPGTKVRQLGGGEVRYPLFHAKIEPDILCLGFNITVEDALAGLGWFFVLKQRPGAIQFGMDSPDPSSENENTMATWDDLNWAHFDSTIRYIDLESDIPVNPGDDGGVAWGRDAANMAWILYQKPFQLAIHAQALLPQQNPAE